MWRCGKNNHHRIFSKGQLCNPIELGGIPFIIAHFSATFCTGILLMIYSSSHESQIKKQALRVIFHSKLAEQCPVGEWPSIHQLFIVVLLSHTKNNPPSSSRSFLFKIPPRSGCSHTNTQVHTGKWEIFLTAFFTDLLLYGYIYLFAVGFITFSHKFSINPLTNLNSSNKGSPAGWIFGWIFNIGSSTWGYHINSRKTLDLIFSLITLLVLKRTEVIIIPSDPATTRSCI